MVSLAGSASLVALPPVRVLLLFVKHLFVAATFTTRRRTGYGDDGHDLVWFLIASRHSANWALCNVGEPLREAE